MSDDEEVAFVIIIFNLSRPGPLYTTVNLEIFDVKIFS